MKRKKSSNTDIAHAETDKMVDELEKRITDEYTQAEKELEKKIDDYFKGFEKRDAKKRQDLADGKITKSEYSEWRVRQMITGKRWLDMKDTISQDLTHAREIAKNIAYSKQLDVYALNHNWGTYEIESQTGIDTNFTLYNRDTVAALIEDKKVLKEPGAELTKKIKEGKAKQWTDRQISSVVLQAVLQGESIPHMAKRISRQLGESEKKSAIRTARTACTSAQNLGRMNSYKRAEGMGIKLKKQWVAGHDNRTRDWHRFLDGTRVEVDKPFVNDWGEIRYPGDPTAAAANVYNCRCCIIAAVNGHEIEASEVYKNDHKDELEGISWEEWKKGKQKNQKQAKTFKNKAKQGIINKAKVVVRNEEAEKRSPVTRKVIHEELQKTSVGMQTIQCLEEHQNIKLTFIYDKVFKTDRGQQIGDNIELYMQNISSPLVAAQTLTHEVTHHRFGIGGCQKAEAICMAYEKMLKENRTYLYNDEWEYVKKLAIDNYPELIWENERIGIHEEYIRVFRRYS